MTSSSLPALRMAFEAKETHFAEILSIRIRSLFRYRGFTEEELRKAL